MRGKDINRKLTGQHSGSVIETPFGHCAVLANDKGRIVRFLLPTTRKTAEAFIVNCQNEVKNGIKSAIIAYFSGKTIDLQEFQIDMDSFPPFHKKVYEELRNVGVGKVLTYAELAKRVGIPKGYRAVGNAMAKNPIPLFIPCHRVIRSDGNIGKFTTPGGSTLKRKMLDLERNSVDGFR